MQCDEFQTRLNSVLDERRDPAMDPQLLSHIKACPLCDETLQIGSQFANLWRTEPTVAVQRAGNTTRSVKRLSALLSVVAALFLTVCSWNQVTAPKVDGLSVIEEVATTKTVEQPTIASEPVEAAFVHQPLISLSLLSTADWNYPLDDIPPPFAATLSGIQPHWKDAVSDGMAPVQKSMSKTLAAISRSF